MKQEKGLDVFKEEKCGASSLYSLFCGLVALCGFFCDERMKRNHKKKKKPPLMGCFSNHNCDHSKWEPLKTVVKNKNTF